MIGKGGSKELAGEMNGGRRGLSLARLWGPGGAGVGRKDSFAAPPLCRRARALRLLGRVGPWGGCLSGFGGALGAFSAQERIERAQKGGLDLLLRDSLEVVMFGEWKLQAGRGGLGMSGAACVRVSGVRDDLSSGLGRGLRFGAGAREPFWRGDLGAVGEQGAGGLGRSVTPHLGPAAPFAWLGCSGWGVGGGGVSTAGLLFAPGRIFFCLEPCLAPCLPASLPFCRLFAAGGPTPAPFWSG